MILIFLQEDTILPVYLELGLILICVVFLGLIFRKYLQSKKKLQMNVFLIFFFIVLAMFLVWVSRVTYYSMNVEAMDPNSLVGWLMFRIGFYRFSFVFICATCYLSYRLKLSIFDPHPKEGYHTVILIYGIISAAFSLLFFDLAIPAYDLIAFFLMFLYILVVYSEFMLKAYKLALRVEDPVYQQGIRSLAIMALCFILTITFFLLDRVMILATGNYYSVFYYLADVSLLVGIIFAYFGYIRPGN